MMDRLSSALPGRSVSDGLNRSASDGLGRAHECPARPDPATILFDARYIIDQYHGIGRHAYNLIEALTRLDPGRRYVLYHCPSYPNSRFDLHALTARPNVELRSVRVPLYSPKEQLFWLRELARRETVIFHSPYVALPLLPLRKRPPLLMTVHDLILERFPAYAPSAIVRRLYLAQTHLSLRRAAAVLTVSEATRKDIEAYYPLAAGKTRVIGGAVDTTFLPVEDPTQLRAIRERYSLPDRFILVVGAGRPHKNVEAVVDAMAHLDPAIAPALAVAGEVDSRFEDGVTQRSRARGLDGRVIRLGKIPEADLPALYTLAEVFVFPSLVEGFGLPPLEAMACGTPVLAASASSIPEVLGDSALFFDPQDVRQLVQLLLRVLSSTTLRRQLSRRGLDRARRLTWDRVAVATLGVYADILGTSEAPSHVTGTTAA
jgi:glycosyltransferase involved in cell wall biosynthesis